MSENFSLTLPVCHGKLLEHTHSYEDSKLVGILPVKRPDQQVWLSAILRCLRHWDSAGRKKSEEALVVSQLEPPQAISLARHVDYLM